MMRNLSFAVQKKEIREGRLRNEDLDKENGSRQRIGI